MISYLTLQWWLWFIVNWSVLFVFASENMASEAGSLCDGYEMNYLAPQQWKNPLFEDIVAVQSSLWDARWPKSSPDSPSTSLRDKGLEMEPLSLWEKRIGIARIF